MAADDEVYTDGDYQYTVSGNVATIVKYTGSDEDVWIPSRVGEYLVREIGCDINYNGAFKNNSNLVSVNIPESVTTIGTSAFYGCSKLVGVTIPNSVTSIERRAFQECTALPSISIPNSVTSIGQGAFVQCRSLTEVTIPDSVTTISQGAFYDCFG